MVPSRLRLVLERLDPSLYALWAAAWTLASARRFYGYMLEQTGGEWSAPLDDVFIHFDYARATALGHPFEWVVGNGYSSGNTSLTYPFVLALGWRIGFRDQRLMIWAAVVAMVSVFGLLLAMRAVFARASVGPGAGRDFDGWGRASSYVLPPLVLGLGALAWSLWSGMEVAFFLGVWAIALLAYFSLIRAIAEGRPTAGRAWTLGALGAAMLATRPEAATTIATFGVAAALTLRPPGAPSADGGRPPWRPAIALLARVGSPAVLLLVVQSIVNRTMTGEWAANGAIVKLGVNNPYYTRAEVLTDIKENLTHAVFKNIEYHFAEGPHLGAMIPALAVAALAFPETRRIAAVLWAEVVGWIVLVSLNGQVRWQNERYTMPAVAWVVLLAALGASALVRRGARPNRLTLAAGAAGLYAMYVYLVAVRPPPPGGRAYLLGVAAAYVAGVAIALIFWPSRVLLTLAALAVFQREQGPKMREQKWFFGRASRNVRDQHVTTGRWLAAQNVRRVLVGDAGAIVYAADRPALDIIGLGGFHDLPFARAGLHGLAATIELMEHVPPGERPDVMAIYPSWWGVLSTWFTSEEVARFPAVGNVICGGYEDVVYRADWHLLGSGTRLRAVPEGEQVRDVVDVADLVSEREHAYRFPHPAGGWAEMRVLPDPAAPDRDLLDGGRRINPGRAERFTMRGLSAHAPAHLVVRFMPEGTARVRVRIDGRDTTTIDVPPADGWIERSVKIPGDRVGSKIDVELVDEGPDDYVDTHIWMTQGTE